MSGSSQGNLRSDPGSTKAHAKLCYHNNDRLLGNRHVSEHRKAPKRVVEKDRCKKQCPCILPHTAKVTGNKSCDSESCDGNEERHPETPNGRSLQGIGNHSLKSRPVFGRELLDRSLDFCMC